MRSRSMNVKIFATFRHASLRV